MWLVLAPCPYLLALISKWRRRLTANTCSLPEAFFFFFSWPWKHPWLQLMASWKCWSGREWPGHNPGSLTRDKKGRIGLVVHSHCSQCALQPDRSSRVASCSKWHWLLHLPSLLPPSITATFWDHPHPSPSTSHA